MLAASTFEGPLNTCSMVVTNNQARNHSVAVCSVYLNMSCVTRHATTCNHLVTWHFLAGADEFASNADDTDDEHLEGMDTSTGNAAANGAAEGSEVVLKFECQMYKVRDDEYLIDIQVRLCI